jgi:hypothetical protein
MLPTVFNCYDQDRLSAWKQFRDTLETSKTPFEDVAELWSHAPFVSPYLDYQNPKSWPDPWHLVLDSRLDELAITLGMLYTIKLTERFRDSKCEICRIKFPSDKEHSYILVVDNQSVLNLEYNRVVGVDKLGECESNLLWTAPYLW